MALGRLLGAETLDVAQDEWHAVLRLQAPDRRFEDVAQFSLLGDGVRLRAGIDGLFELFLERDDGRTAGAPTGEPVGLVDTDPVEPGEELALALEAVDGPPRAQERLLGDLVGLVRTVDEASDDGVQAIGVTPDEFLERHAVALLSAGDERLIVGCVLPHAAQLVRRIVRTWPSDPRSLRRIQNRPTNRPVQLSMNALSPRR